MKKPALVLLLMASMTASTVAKADQPPCPGVISGKSSPSDVEGFYADRAVAIVRAAVANDEAQLSKLVDPNTTFEVWQGNSSRESRQTGIPGVVEIIGFVNPARTQAAIPVYGPISIAAPPEIGPQCTWNATLLLRRGQPSQGFEIRFDFVDGRLTSALGHEVVLVETTSVSARGRSAFVLFSSKTGLSGTPNFPVECPGEADARSGLSGPADKADTELLIAGP